jgi:hypothetical protein
MAMQMRVATSTAIVGGKLIQVNVDAPASS